MAHIIAKQAVRLRTETGEVHISPGPHAQHLPDDFTNDPYYAMCVESGYLVEMKMEPASEVTVEPPDAIEPDPQMAAAEETEANEPVAEPAEEEAADETPAAEPAADEQQQRSRRRRG